MTTPARLVFALWRQRAGNLFKLMRKMIKWTSDRNVIELILRCVERAEKIRTIDRTKLMMDLEAAHENGTPLDFAKLLAFPDIDFSHDVFGIVRNIDRKTGKLKNLFEPRCAFPVAAKAA